MASLPFSPVLIRIAFSIDDTKTIINALKLKYPEIGASPKEDICYATSNRQKAIKEYAKMCDSFIVVGSNNSSNSKAVILVSLIFS